jgi:recombination protein RecR
MIRSVPHLKQLIRHLQQVPYLASKNLYRVVDHLLASDLDAIQGLCLAITQARDQVMRCSKCFVWMEREGSCVFCADVRRDQTLICVVQSWQDALSIEMTEGYKGLYHVLCGLVSPLDGVGPDDLTVGQLAERVRNGTVKEIILALNQTPEGEATSVYISQQLRSEAATISSLARGVPVGATIAFMDRLTIYQALSDRRVIGQKQR